MTIEEIIRLDLEIRTKIDQSKVRICPGDDLAFVRREAKARHNV